MTISVSQKLLKIKELICEDLLLRASAIELFKNIDSIKNTEVVLDFDGIRSMNRSFAQELLSQIDQRENHITIINESEDIKKMFDVVRWPTKKFIITNNNSKMVYL